MKKYLSVFSLTARESMVKISVLWVLSAALQSAVFYMNMLSERIQDNKFLSEAYSTYVDSDNINIPFVFSFTLIIMGILLMKTGMEFRTRTGYTLRRLRISEKQVFLTQSVYNCIMIFMLFVFETALCFFLAKWGTTLIEPEYITNQTVYLAFYTADFLKGIFAGRNIVTVIRNIVIIISLGFNLAAFSYLWRRGSKYLFGLLVLVAAVILFWVGDGFSYAGNIAVLLVALGAFFVALGIVRSRREGYDT